MERYVREILGTAFKAIGSFVEKLGYDAPEYISLTNTPPIVFAPSLPDTSCCKYLSPIKALKVMKKYNSEEQFYDIIDKGIFVISKEEVVKDSEVALYEFIKQLYYSNNNFIVDDYEYGINFEDIRLERITELQKISFVDYFSEILKGEVDICRQSTKKNFDKNEEELQQNNFTLLRVQREVYDRLLFVMAFSTIRIFNNNKLSIEDTLLEYIKLNEGLNDSFNIKTNTIVKFIVNNESYDIFKCIIDPLTYSLGDIHCNELMSFFTDRQVESLYQMFSLDTDEYGYGYTKSL